jgi:hypothetical protein
VTERGGKTKYDQIEQNGEDTVRVRVRVRVRVS